LSVAGLEALLGPVAIPVVVVLVLLLAWYWAPRWIRTHGWPGARPTGWSSAPSPALATASTDELCSYWRDSYLRLIHPMNATERARLAAVRCELLAEFECRDPTGFARFLGPPTQPRAIPAGTAAAPTIRPSRPLDPVGPAGDP